MPTSDQKKLVLAPAEVLIDLLRQMEATPNRAKSRYLLALMLMRRKLVRPAPIESEDSNTLLRVEVIADGSVVEVPICEISRGEADALRAELDELLYCEAEPVVDSDDDAVHRDDASS
jgi:hypothetical protein